MNAVEKIFNLLDNKYYEEAVPLGMEYFKLEFSLDGMKLLAPSQSLIGELEISQRLYFYDVARLYYLYAGKPAHACAFGEEILKLLKSLPLQWKYYSKYLMQCHYLFMTKEKYFQLHQGYNALFKDIWQFKHNREIHKKHKKIRIGYLSEDFRKCVLVDFIRVLVAYYKQDDFQVYCFSNSDIDEMTEFYRSCPVEWVDITGLNAPDAARAIYAREIDILFDLAGHSRNNLPILAYKPAPVQLCGIGYFATTGLDRVDYFLTDRYLHHNNVDKYFVEKLLVMPQSHFCYWPRSNMPQEIHGTPAQKKRLHYLRQL